MKNIPVIGGNGFLGSALIRDLQQADYAHVHSVDLAPFPDDSVESIV